MIVPRHTCQACMYWDPQEGTVDTAQRGYCTAVQSGRLPMHREGGCVQWRLNEAAFELVCRRRAPGGA